MGSDKLKDDLYPVIPDTEFRGKGYFNAVVKDGQFSVKTENPDTYGAAAYGGDELLLEKRDSDTFWVCAVKRDGLWKTPRPTYEEVYLRYIINADDLETIVPR